VPGDNIPLPMAMIGKIPFTVAIDSVHIRESAIFYEVFPEHGFQTGNVSFEKLEATLDHISNHSFYTTHTQATMAAHATLMKQGLIAASFSLPYDENQQYRATGTITHLPLPQLNPILENLAFIRIVSGKLNALNFDFSYNDLKSTGSVLVNYEDLKIQSLTKEQEPTTKEFKSFLINTLLRNTKDKNLPRQKRTGLISFERDRKKAVFNLWFRSILSGLEKSVIDFPASPEKQKPKP
jgi:hypothetical protein